MKFVYEYRTSDNVKHNGVVAASNREAAFAALKAQGIRPGSLAEAPGFFNKLFGKGKRWLAIGILGCLVVVAAFVIRSNNRTIRTIEQSQEAFDSPVRRQIVGDRAIIEKGIRTGWADVFALEGDRFLASFALPGVEPGIRATTVENLQEALSHDCAATTPGCDASSLETRQILAIVGGMKKEIAALRESGWTLKEVGAALVRRQEKEIGFYRIAVQALEAAKKSGASKVDLLVLWEKKNDELRKLGVRLLSMPE